MVDSSLMPNKRQLFAGDKTFRMGIVGSSGGGKSTLLEQIVTGEDFNLISKYRPDQIFVVCPTINLDPVYSKIADFLEENSTKEHRFDREKQFFHKDLEVNLENTYKMIFEEQQGKKQGKLDMKNYLIILDDVIGEMNTQQSGLLSKMLTKIRHINCSLIILLQQFKQLSPTSRNQLNMLAIFNISLNDELKKISNEVRGSMSSKQFDGIMAYAVEKPYGFLFINLNLPLKYRFFFGNGDKIQQLQL